MSEVLSVLSISYRDETGEDQTLRELTEEGETLGDFIERAFQHNADKKRLKEIRAAL